MAEHRLRVGVFGAGTVGGGVVEILRKAASKLAALNVRIEICKICVRSLEKERTFTMPSECSIVTDYDEILNDDSIDCVVEVMGGVTDAKHVVFQAIRNGKHVVTANKALVASHLSELEQLLAEHPHVKFAFEAAVCGGIPIIHTLQTDYSADQITALAGIMNDTTNYMLSRMQAEGASYDEVLEEAQALGYAEADPSADVDGLDVQAKICIATRLAFGVTVDTAQIPTIGIREVSAIDFEYAKTLNRTIKLLATARRLANGKLSVYVSPALVPKTHPLATCSGAENLVHVTSQFLGGASYSGGGAGRFPTANGVVNDLVRIARGTCPDPFTPPQQWDLEFDYVASFYIRMTIVDQLGVIRRIGEVAEKHGISIYAILQNPIVDPRRVDFVVTTDECHHSQVQTFVEEMATQSFALERPFYMSIL